MDMKEVDGRQTESSLEEDLLSSIDLQTAESQCVCVRPMSVVTGQGPYEQYLMGRYFLYGLESLIVDDVYFNYGTLSP